MGSHDTCHLMGSHANWYGNAWPLKAITMGPLGKLWVPMESHEVAWYLPWEPMASHVIPGQLPGHGNPMVYSNGSEWNPMGFDWDPMNPRLTTWTRTFETRRSWELLFPGLKTSV